MNIQILMNLYLQNCEIIIKTLKCRIYKGSNFYQHHMLIYLEYIYVWNNRNIRNTQML